MGGTQRAGRLRGGVPRAAEVEALGQAAVRKERKGR